MSTNPLNLQSTVHLHNTWRPEDPTACRAGQGLLPGAGGGVGETGRGVGAGGGNVAGVGAGGQTQEQEDRE